MQPISTSRFFVKVLFNTLFGSHIYGTNTPNSDKDYKGIFIADKRDILMGINTHSIVKSTGENFSRNSKDDVDTEFKELRRFIQDALVGQTYSVDMLYSPRELWTTTSPEWEFIVANRSKFLSKNMSAFISYCNQQASKYGLKGTRLGAVLDVIEKLKSFDPDSKLGDNPRFSENNYVKYKVHKHKASTGIKDEEMLDVLGKLYGQTVLVKNVLKSLEIFEQRYGERAKIAMLNEGIDFKAISHAYRCCYELQDMALRGDVIFPMTQAKKLIDIKTAKVSYPKVIQDELPELMEETVEMVRTSSLLPEKPDFKFWDNYLYETYLNYIKND